MTFSLYAGTGAQLTVGQNPNGAGFASLQFGVGIGAGASYDPEAKAPGYDPSWGASWTLGYGLFGKWSGRAGPLSASLSANTGRNVNSCGNGAYSQGITPNVTAKSSFFGIGGSVSAGGQFTLSGGGSAKGACTCGGG